MSLAAGVNTSVGVLPNDATVVHGSWVEDQGIWLEMGGLGHLLTSLTPLPSEFNTSVFQKGWLTDGSFEDAIQMMERWLTACRCKG